jgi:hypothetical protein
LPSSASGASERPGRVPARLLPARQRPSPQTTARGASVTELIRSSHKAPPPGWGECAGGRGRDPRAANPGDRALPGRYAGLPKTPASPHPCSCSATTPCSSCRRCRPGSPATAWRPPSIRRRAAARHGSRHLRPRHSGQNHQARPRGPATNRLRYVRQRLLDAAPAVAPRRTVRGSARQSRHRALGRWTWRGFKSSTANGCGAPRPLPNRGCLPEPAGRGSRQKCH